MDRIFHGWRRKTGFMTLVLACVFAGGWVRSLVRQDVLIVPTGVISQHRLYSIDQWLVWETILSKQFRERITNLIEWQSRASRRPDDLDICFTFQGMSEGWCGFNIGGGTWGSEPSVSNPNVGYKRTFWTIPYWSIVVPLTLLSVWLLLSRPRVQRSVVAEAKSDTSVPQSRCVE